MFSRLLLAVVALAGCTPGICGRTSDCATGYVCAASGACVLPPSDGGAGDDAATSPVADAAVDATQVEPADATVDGPAIDAPGATGARGAR
jgi:hypothetical protein